MQLSLCMIVRDSATTLSACLESVRHYVDEMVVVDTGSHDETVAIAQNCGARVFHFPWCDSFAAARNESFRHARGDWIFWLDSDDTIPARCGQELRALTLQPADVLGILVSHVHCPLPEALSVVDHVKLVRNRPDLRFEGRVHEQILPSIRRAGGAVVRSDIYVVHSGADFSVATRDRKRFNYLRLLEMELEEHPGQPFALFNLGMTHCEGGNYADAVFALEQCIALSDSDEIFVAKAFGFLAFSLRKLGHLSRAEAECRRGLCRFSQEAELHFQLGMTCFEASRFEEAILAYKAALEFNSDSSASPVNRAFPQNKARHNLALAYLTVNKPRYAEQEWRKVIEQTPNCRAAWEGLAEALLLQSKIRELDSIAGRMSGWRADLLRARAALARERSDEARMLAAKVECGKDPVAWRALARFFFEAGWGVDAEKALQVLLQLTPADAVAHHNLGLLFVALGRHEEAVAAFHESLRLQPNNVETGKLLAAALEKLGQQSEATRIRHKLSALPMTVRTSSPIWRA